MLNKFFYKPFISFGLIFIISNPVFGQFDIPVGSWRLHISFSESRDIALSDNAVYCAAKNGIFYLEKDDNSLHTLTKIDGLNDADITKIDYDLLNEILAIGYSNGNVDMVTEDAIINYPAIKNAKNESRTINDFLFEGSRSYISTDFGVVVFDIQKFETLEAYTNIGKDGDQLQILEAEIHNDSLFLASADGVIAGWLDPANNLQDFNNWHRFDASDGIPGSLISGITTFNNHLFASLKNDGIYKYSNGKWIKEPYLNGESIISISGHQNLMAVTSESCAWTVDKKDVVSAITSEFIESPNITLLDDQNILWVSDSKNSLVTNVAGSFNSISASGPNSDRFAFMYYSDNRLIGLPGGYDQQRKPLEDSLGFYTFSEGLWENFNFPSYPVASDLTGGTFISESNLHFLVSFGSGITLWDRGTAISTLTLSHPDYPFNSNFLTSVFAAKDGTWVSVWDSQPALYQSTDGISWEPHIVNISGEENILEIIEDTFGTKWLRVDPEKRGGIIVYDASNGDSRWINSTQNEGNLPSNRVNDLEIDNKGNIWVGTDKGVVYFPRGIDPFSTNLQSIRPIFEGGFLFDNEQIRAIKADGGNRKWIGTMVGVWLFDEFGEDLIEFFNEENSPLLSDQISMIEINDVTGEVFFATLNGLSSFRSDATEGGNQHSNVKIFPNPVTPDYSGLVTIEGLPENAEIKITDVSGNLVWQMKSNGGTATWKLTTLYGSNPGTGIYMIYSSTSDGSDTFVGKIAIIN